jgi:hypothetical protein
MSFVPTNDIKGAELACTTAKQTPHAAGLSMLAMLVKQKLAVLY